MSRTLSQQMGDAHERDIAEWIGGKQQKGSGNQWHAQMDVVNDERAPFPLAADGKATLGKSISITREMWRKAVEQTFSKIPTLWLRWYKDESLRVVDLDLVAINRSDFLELLDAARKWKDHNNRHILEMAKLAAQPRVEIKTEPGCDCCR